MSESTARDRPLRVLPLIVIGQVLATSTWFAANAVARDIGGEGALGASVGLITMAVQLGFIAGTLIIATTGLSDAMPGRRLFLICALGAAATNAMILVSPANYLFVLLCRFLTGLTLAGVYPVGMRIAASWYATGLGRALGYLVGALVLGTSLTHLVRAVPVIEHWQYAIVTSSLAAIVGGLLVSCVPDGPHLKPSGQRWQLSQLGNAFSLPDFRRAALAYFGHMWELYAFWAFMPRWIESLGLSPQLVSLISFTIIAMGALGCVLGGMATESYGSRRVARFFLMISAACCLLSPVVYGAPIWILILFLIIWGIAVVGDSPQLSSLNAQSAPRNIVGSALTATTCIGFSITVASLLLLDWIAVHTQPRLLFLILAIGPMIGCWSLRSDERLRDRRSNY